MRDIDWPRLFHMLISRSYRVLDRRRGLPAPSPLQSPLQVFRERCCGALQISRTNI